MTTCTKHICFWLTLLATTAEMTHGGEDSGKTTVLDPAKKQVKKLTVTSSQIGYRSTLVFYTFHEEKAVLKVLIDNKNMDFPIAANVYVFAEDTSDEGLAMWLNNQHSDGLFPEVPNPVAMGKIPAKSCKVLSHKVVGKEKQPFGNFDKYSVEFQFKKVPATKGVQIKDFKDTAPVYVKSE